MVLSGASAVSFESIKILIVIVEMIIQADAPILAVFCQLEASADTNDPG